MSRPQRFLCSLLLSVGLTACGSDPAGVGEIGADTGADARPADALTDVGEDPVDTRSDAPDAPSDSGDPSDVPVDLTADLDLGSDSDAAPETGGDVVPDQGDAASDAEPELPEIDIRVDALPDVEEDAVELGPNNAPILSATDPAYARVGALMAHPVAAHDLDGDGVLVALVDGPPGLVYDAAEGGLRWTPGAEDQRVHRVTISATDGRDSSELELEIRVRADTIVATPESAVTDVRVPADSPPPDPLRSVVAFTATPGEFEPRSLRLYASGATLERATVQFSAERADGVEFPAGSFDVRAVKRWFQAGTDHRITGARVLVPELLLRDPQLVRSAEGRNEVRLSDGSYLDVSESAELSTRVVVAPADLPIQDVAAFAGLEVVEGTNEALWITVEVPADQPAGIYVGELTVYDDDRPVEWLPLHIEVLPFRLEPSPITQSVYYRAELSDDWPEGSISSEFKSESQLAAELQNMVDHGLTNPTVYQSAESDLFERYLTLRAESGMADQPVYLVRENAIFFRRTPEEFAANIVDVINRSQELGATDVYFMGRDEARTEDLLAQRDAWAAVRDAGGHVWAAGYRSTSWLGEGNHELMGDVQDLLICAYRPSAQEAALWHESGGQIFVYENPQGGLEYPEVYRRNFGLLLWQENYDGAMTYAWQDSFGNGWNDFDHERMRDFNFAYPTVDGVIDTIQWEGYREGVDDLRYLATLVAAIDRAAASGADPTEAEDWLETLQTEPLARTELDAVRDTMVGHILALREVTSTTGALVTIENVRLGGFESGAIPLAWSTSERARSWVEWGRTRALGNHTPVSQSLRREHTHQVPVPRPEGIVYIRGVTEDASGLAVNTPTFEIDLDVAPRIVLGPPTPEDGESVSALRVRGVIDSDKRASAFVDIDRSLLGWWGFSEDAAADSSSWARPTTLQNGAGELGAGWLGRGLEMDGVDDYLSVGDLGIPENGTATIEAWIRLNSLPVDAGGAIGLFTQVYLHPVNDHIYFRGTNDWFRSSSNLTVGVWHHIVLSWAGDTGTARLWIDAKELPMNVQGEPEEILSFEDFRIGRSFGYFDGAMDEVRVWNRVLSGDEVRASYDANRGEFFAADFDGLAPGAHTFQVTAADSLDQLSVTPTRTVTVE